MLFYFSFEILHNSIDHGDFGTGEEDFVSLLNIPCKSLRVIFQDVLNSYLLRYSGGTVWCSTAPPRLAGGPSDLCAAEVVKDKRSDVGHGGLAPARVILNTCHPPLNVHILHIMMLPQYRRIHLCWLYPESPVRTMISYCCVLQVIAVSSTPFGVSWQFLRLSYFRLVGTCSGGCLHSSSRIEWHEKLMWCMTFVSWYQPRDHP